MGTKFFGQEHTLSSCIYGIRFKVLSFSNTMWIMAVELFVMAQSLLVTMQASAILRLYDLCVENSEINRCLP